MYSKIVVNNGAALKIYCRNKSGSQINFQAKSEVTIEEGGWMDIDWLYFMSEANVIVRGLLSLDSEYNRLGVAYAAWNNNPDFRVENNGVVRIGHDKGALEVASSSPSTSARGSMTLADNGTVTNKGTLYVGRNDKATKARWARGIVNIDGGQWYNDGTVYVVGWKVDDSSYGTVIDYETLHNEHTEGTFNQSDGLFRTWSNVYVANGPSKGLLNLMGGEFYVTNDSQNATLYVSSMISSDNSLTKPGLATLRLDGNGVLRVDKIIGTQGEDFSNVDFRGGTLETASTDLDLGKTLVIGDGMQEATLILLGGTHTFADDVKINGDAMLKGTGTINAPTLKIAADGILAPGSSPGTLSLNGDLELDSGSIFEVEIGGLNAGTQYDVLQVLSGTADLSGELRVKLVNGFVPDNADFFDVLTTSGGISGNFENLDSGRVVVDGGPGSFEVDLSGGKVRLFNYVIPEPASTVMLLVGGLAFALRRRLRARSR